MRDAVRRADGGVPAGTSLPGGETFNGAQPPTHAERLATAGLLGNLCRICTSSTRCAADVCRARPLDVSGGRTAAEGSRPSFLLPSPGRGGGGDFVRPTAAHGAGRAGRAGGVEPVLAHGRRHHGEPHGGLGLRPRAQRDHLPSDGPGDPRHRYAGAVGDVDRHSTWRPSPHDGQRSPRSAAVLGGVPYIWCGRERVRGGARQDHDPGPHGRRLLPLPPQGRPRGPGTGWRPTVARCTGARRIVYLGAARDRAASAGSRQRAST